MRRNSAVRLCFIQYLEKLRAEAATPDEVCAWFLELRSIVRRSDIRPENTWNCDEKGIIMGVALGRTKVIAVLDFYLSSLY